MVKMIDGLGGKLLLFLSSRKKYGLAERCVVILEDGNRCKSAGNQSYGGRLHCADHYAQRLDNSRPRVKTPPIIVRSPRKK